MFVPNQIYVNVIDAPRPVENDDNGTHRMANAEWK